MLSIVTLSAFLVYCQYLLGMLTPSATGLVIFPFCAFFLLTILGSNSRFSLFFVLSCVVLILVLTLSFANSSLASYPQYKFLFTTIKWVSYLIIGYYVYSNSYAYFRVAFFVLLIFSIYCLGSIFVGNYEFDINNRLFVGVYNPIWIGRAIYEMLLISIVCLGVKKNYTIILFIVCLYISYATGSKSSILAFLIVATLYFSREMQMSKVKKFILFSLLVLFVISILYFFKDDAYFQSRFLSLVPENSSDGVYNSSRIVVWPKTLSLFLSQNYMEILFGNGLGEFPKFYLGVEANFKYYPHNAILELLVEFGLLFTLAIVFYVTYFYLKCKESIRYLLLYYIICAMFSGDLLLNEFVFLYLGMVIKSVRYTSFKVAM
ncbi:O-antigen ligase family protein [Vibrio diabolicus]|uniref:O-antigen ligase family protein n=1 Tax=Vibrio diabolicus TaxID=50719 RepID=UPI003752F699